MGKETSENSAVFERFDDLKPHSASRKESLNRYGDTPPKSNADYDDDFDDADFISEKSPSATVTNTVTVDVVSRSSENEEVTNTSSVKELSRSASNPSVRDGSVKEETTSVPGLMSPKPLSKGRERLQSAGDDNLYGDDDFEDFDE